MNLIKKFIGISLVLIIYSSSYGQEFLLNNLEQVGQRNKINPAFTIDAPVFAGFPLTSSIMMSYQNNGFKYSDLVKKGSNDSLYLDIAGAINEMNTQNNIHAETSNDIIWFGFKAGKNHFTVNVTEKANFNLSYSKSMMEFLYYGNGGYNGNSGNINPGIDATHYREYGLTWAREIIKGVTGGISLKYLYGMEHIHTEGLGVTLYTDPNDYTLYGYSEYTVYTSGMTSESFDGISAGEYLIGKNNNGFGMDLGITVTPSDKIEISASVLDIGGINWNEDVVVYSSVTSDGPIIYEGINLDEFINEGNGSDIFLNNLSDSIYSAFNVQESNESFSSSLPKQVYTSFTYRTGLKSKVGATMHLRETPTKSVVSYNVHYTSSVKEWFNYSIGYSSINQSHGNVGLSCAFNLKAGQMYVATDNVIGLVNYKNANIVNLRAGFNFIFSGKEAAKKNTAPINNIEDIQSEHKTVVE
jgi:Family of unknown function (DUF5723)